MEYFGETLNIDNGLLEDAENYYRNELKPQFNGDDLTYITVATYIQCRQSGDVRSRKQFAKAISDVLMNRKKSDTFKELTSAYLKVRKKTEIDMRTVRPQDYLSYMREALDMSEDELEDARSYCEEMMQDPKFSGRDPACLCGAAIYLGTNRTLKDISNETATSPSTLNNIKEIVDEDE